jgi:myosin heavy chain 6/7
VLDAHLVLHQLHCNGVLEGIRICRKGFPSRIPYADFVQRYSILAPNAIKANKADPKKATSETLKEVALNEELYRIGLTKVLFKAGVLGTLEEYRDNAISKILTYLQAYIRFYQMKKYYKVMLQQKLALSCIQRNLKAYIDMRNWGWWKLFCKMKPLLQNAKKAEEEAKAKVKFINYCKLFLNAIRNISEKYTNYTLQKFVLYPMIQKFLKKLFYQR